MGGSCMLGDLQDIFVEGNKVRGAAREGRSWPGVKVESGQEVLEGVEVGGGWRSLEEVQKDWGRLEEVGGSED